MNKFIHFKFKTTFSNKHTLRSFILDALGRGIFDFLVCFFKIGEFGLKSVKIKTINKIKYIYFKQVFYQILVQAVHLKEMTYFDSILNAIH